MSKVISPYLRGADDGLRFGLYLSALLLSVMLSARMPLLSLAAFVMMAGVPVWTYMCQRRYARTLGMAATVPMLWMQGVVMFTGGIVIASAVIVAYMRWADPAYIFNQWQSIAAMATRPEASDFYRQTGAMAQAMIEAGTLPTPLEMAWQFILLTVSTGSILSLIMGAIVCRRTKQHPFIHSRTHD